MMRNYICSLFCCFNLAQGAFFFSLGCAEIGSADVIAGFRSDFQTGCFPDRWEYLWNAPDGWLPGGSSGALSTGWITETNLYRTMIPAGTIWTADGETDGSNSFPDRYVRLTSTGGHPGSYAGEVVGGESNRADRYAIAAYTVAANGYYAITDSFVRKGSLLSDGVEAVVHINGQSPVRTAVAQPGGEAVDFDINLGWLAAGDTVYVCFGALGSAFYDAFTTDYKITKYAGPNDLRAVVTNAIAAGGNPVVIPPGHYRQTAENGIHISLSGLENRTLQMDGVRMICTETTRALSVMNCDNTLISGLSIDYSPLPFTQFRITSISPDYTSFNMELINGYTATEFSGDQNSLKIFDSETGIMRKIYGQAVANTAQTGGRTFHYTKVSAYTYDPEALDHEQVGDTVVVSTRYSPGGTELNHAVLVGGSSDLVFSNISIFSAMHMAVFEGSCSNVTYDTVNIQPCPMADDYRLRDAPRYQSSSRDGFHLTGNKGTTRLYNCIVEYNDDDCVNIHRSANLVQDVSGNTITVVDRLGARVVHPGDTVEFVSMDGEKLGAAIIVNATAGTGIPTQAILDFWEQYMNVLPEPVKTWTLELNAVVPGISMGTMVYSLNQSGCRNEIIGCRFAHGRARGIVLRRSNTLVENNRIEYRWSPGIMICGDFQSLEGEFPGQVEIVNNEIFSSKKDAVYVDVEALSGEPSVTGLYNDIIITSNHLGGAEQDIRLRGVDGWLLDSNTYVLEPRVDVRNCTNGNVYSRYSESFQPATFPANWNYLWNAPFGWAAGGIPGDVKTGPLGDPTCYQEIASDGTVWSADGDADGSNSSPDHYLRLTGIGGHPGAEAGYDVDGVLNAYDRNAIAAYRLPEAGRYVIGGSFLRKTSSAGDAVDISVHVNHHASLLNRSATPGGSAIDFDCDFGTRAAGDTVYVCFGPGDSAAHDSFQADFSVVQIESGIYDDFLSGDLSKWIFTAQNPQRTDPQVINGQLVWGSSSNPAFGVEALVSAQSVFDLNSSSIGSPFFIQVKISDIIARSGTEDESHDSFSIGFADSEGDLVRARYSFSLTDRTSHPAVFQLLYTPAGGATVVMGRNVNYDVYPLQSGDLLSLTYNGADQFAVYRDRAGEKTHLFSRNYSAHTIDGEAYLYLDHNNQGFGAEITLENVASGFR